MLPVKSVIIFTSLSGAGYGLALWLLFLGILYPEVGSASSSVSVPHLIGWGMAGVMVTVGLISSLFHIGHPERFVLALSQWRSSWLSREGVLAILAYVPLGWVAFHDSFLGGTGPEVRYVAMAVIIATVYSTSMIYGSIKAVPLWSQGWTPLVYLASLLSSGLTLGLVYSATTQHEGRLQFLAAALISVMFLFFVVRMWRTSTERGGMTSTIESATGLGTMGKVTLLERPHMTENYLLKEMGYQLARKHAAALRLLATLFGLVGPLLAYTLLIMIHVLQGGPSVLVESLMTASAAVMHLGGIYIQRWLFFAEARHTVMLYYGADAV